MLGIITYSAIVAALIIYIWKRPSIALAGVLCMFGLEQLGQASHPFFSQHQTFTNVLIGGILTLAVGIKFLKGERVFAHYPGIGWIVLSLFCYALASAIWVRRPELTMEIWLGRGPYVFTFLVLTPLIISNARDIEAATKAIILVGTTVAIFLLIFVSWDARSIVLEGGHGNPLAVSQMAGMVALVAILGNPWGNSKIWQVLRWGVVAVCLILVIRAGARGQLLGILIVTLACWPISRRIRNSSQVFLLVGLIGFLAAVTSYGLQEFWAKQSSYYAGGSRWSEQAMQGAMSGRLEQAFILVRLWYGSPETVLFGLGNSASFDPHVLGMYPHFVPLEILAEEGLIGFSAFLLILFATLQNVTRCYRKTREAPSERPLLAALAAMFLYALLLALKQGSLLNNLELFMFAILIGKYRGLLSLSDPIDSARRFPTALEPNKLGEYPILRHGHVEIGIR